MSVLQQLFVSPGHYSDTGIIAVSNYISSVLVPTHGPESAGTVPQRPLSLPYFLCRFWSRPALADVNKSILIPSPLNGRGTQAHSCPCHTLLRPPPPAQTNSGNCLNFPFPQSQTLQMSALSSRQILTCSELIEVKPTNAI